MHDINFNILKDRAMDVDPDIRFMALEDLRKFLQDESAALTRTTLNQSLENFFPILLNMLNDQNPDVQTQAIKSFEPMVKYLSNETFSKLVKKLFALVQQNSSSTGNVTGMKSFTVSVLTLHFALYLLNQTRETSLSLCLINCQIQIIDLTLIWQDILWIILFLKSLAIRHH